MARNRLNRVLRSASLLLLGGLLGLSAPAHAYHFPWDQGHDTFTPTEPPDEPNPPPDDNQCTLGQAVNAAAGDEVKTYTDFNIPGIGPALILQRTYHSQDLANGPFGIGWHATLTERATVVTDGVDISAIQCRGDGKRKRFKRNADGSFQPAPGTYETLEQNADGTLILSDKHGNIRTFAASGILHEIKDRNANKLTFQYDQIGRLASVTNASGRSLTFTTGADGRIASAADSIGRVFRYDYDTDGHLIKVTDAANGITQYTYDANQNLATVVDPNRNTVVRLSYDDRDRVTQEVVADGGVYTFQYQAASTTRVTDPLGNTTVYTFNDTGNPVSITDPLGNVTRTGWDGNYNRTDSTDGKGNKTQYEYDARGNLIRKTDALGNVWRYTYHPVFNLIASETDPLGHTTSNEYDANGNLVKKTDALGNFTSLTYNTKGKLLTATDPLGNISQFEYDSADNLTGVTDPLGHKTTMAYDGIGNLLSTTDAGGGTARFIYDALNRQVSSVDPVNGVSQIIYDGSGNSVRVIDAEGNATSLVYDNRNRLVQTTNPLGQAERRGYDALGKLTTLTDLVGNSTSYSYDRAGRLAQETRPGGAVYSYEYDTAGNRTAVADPAGMRVDYQYDALNRLVARRYSNNEQERYQYDALGNRIRIERRDAADQVVYGEDTQYDALSRPVQITGAMGQVTLLAYDATGNLSTKTDPMGRPTRKTFDALGRVSQIIDSASGVTYFNYDAAGRLVSVSDPRSLITTYTYDAAGRRTGLDSPDTGQAQSTYDKNGNLTARTDSRGITATQTFDPLNRRTGTNYPSAEEDRTFSYDAGVTGTGRLTGYDDPSGHTDLTYDERGNLVGERRTIQTQNYQLGYVYDAADRLTQIDYPSGLQVTYGYDNQGRITSVSSNAGPILTDISYLPFGPVSGWIDGAGARRTVSYDGSYRITAIDVQDLLQLQYVYDEANNITRQSDALNSGRTQTLTYETLDLLTGAHGSYGNLQFTYDPVGNRLTENDNGQSSQYRYGTNSNRLLSAVGAKANSFTYDAAGNQITSAALTSTYNQANRLAKVEQGAYGIAEYLYNTEGERVVKAAGATVTHFVYGQEGQLLGVYDGSDGSVIEEIVYLGAIPVATVRADQTYFIHTDHLGTPRVVNDSVQQVVWRWDSDPFGAAMANDDPDGNGVAFMFGMRFPGQWFDRETRLHYNYYRDYDPAIGRYIQSDPIGLGGGTNLYYYVANNPENLLDRRGLAWGNPQASWYFYTGQGKDVSLQKTGHYQTVTTKVTPKIEEFKKKVKQQIGGWAGGTGCNSCTSHTTNDAVGVYSGVFWIGGIALKRNADCLLCIVSCAPGMTCPPSTVKSYVYFCNLNFSMRDKFVDPADLDNSGTDFWDHWQFGGTPFDVVAQWADSLSGSGQVTQ